MLFLCFDRGSLTVTFLLLLRFEYFGLLWLFCADLGKFWCYFCLFWFALFDGFPWLPSQLSSTSVLVSIEKVSYLGGCGWVGQDGQKEIG